MAPGLCRLVTVWMGVSAECSPDGRSAHQWGNIYGLFLEKGYVRIGVMRGTLPPRILAKNLEKQKETTVFFF